MFLLPCFGTNPSLYSSALSPELGVQRGLGSCQLMLAFHSLHVTNSGRATVLRDRYAAALCLPFCAMAILTLQEDNATKQNKGCLLKMSNQNHRRAAGVIPKLTEKQRQGRSKL